MFFIELSFLYIKLDALTRDVIKLYGSSLYCLPSFKQKFVYEID